jgi:hypothetical protein
MLLKCKTESVTLREEPRLRAFENRVLRTTFGPKRVEVAGGWRRLRNEELHNLHASPNIVRVIKSKRMRWTGHVAHGRDEKNLVGKPKGRDHSEDTGVDERIILE